MSWFKRYDGWVYMTIVVVMFILGLGRLADANEYAAFNVMDLPPGHSTVIVCYPEGDDGETLVFHTDGKAARATNSTLWSGFVGKRVTLGDAWDATSHIGAIGYGTDRALFVLHIFDDKTKKRVARLFIDFQDPQVFLAGPKPTNEWVYLVWECTHG